jgi:dTDP-4-amino-4,6-dideoxygalactose transaminase
MTELQAAIVLVQWQRRHELAGRARSNAEAIVAAAAEAGLHTVDLFGLDDAVHVVPLLAPIATAPGLGLAIRRSMHDRGVQTADPYPPSDGCSNARSLADRLVLVPCGPALCGNDIDLICVALGSCTQLVRTAGS